MKLCDAFSDKQTALRDGALFTYLKFFPESVTCSGQFESY